MSLEDEIRNYIAKQLSIPPDKITPNSRFAEDLGADSLDFYEIISYLEDRYKFGFENEAEKNMRTLNDLVSYIKLHGKKPE